MRIGIDGRLYNQTGVGRYIRNLIKELSIIDDDNEYFVYLRKKEFEDFSAPNKNWEKRLADLHWHTIKEQIIFPRILLRDNLDVAHFPYFNVPILYSKKYLLTIHDLIVDHFDTGKASTLPYPLFKVKRSGYKISLSLGIKKANWITAISNTTKQEIIDHYRVGKDKITVTYDALDLNFLKTIHSHNAKNYFDFPYILYVGNAYPHKNLERLLQSLKLINKQKKIKLVLAGDDRYFYPRLKRYAQKIGIEKQIIFYGNANDAQLVNLYSYAIGLVFPSLMEGFGLPNFEAIACGIIPVVSDIAVFREIWDSELIYFNPFSEKNMASAILKLINMPSLDYEKRVEKLKKKITQFSWKNTAIKTLEIYNKIHKNFNSE
ncbi:glycosyltransferase family 4 protein [Candidatus Gottesmanbacteria bacterium]|nr:glycosyltransferase family 4 protein [Candidatus Gottesmanbacteria bacterium]